jgi:hypothetical protein
MLLLSISEPIDTSESTHKRPSIQCVLTTRSQHEFKGEPMIFDHKGYIIHPSIFLFLGSIL